MQKGRRKKLYPSRSLPDLKTLLVEKPDGIDLGAVEREIALREKELAYIEAGPGDERMRIRREILEMTGGYSPALPTPQLSPNHDAEGMPVTPNAPEGASTPLKPYSAGDKIYLLD